LNGIAPHIETVAARRGLSVALTIPEFGLLPGKVGHSVVDKLHGARKLGGSYDLLDPDGPVTRLGSWKAFLDDLNVAFDDWSG
jgi:hypothetical protein